MKQYADTKSRHRRVSVGDTVLVRVQKTNKLSTPFSPSTYRVTRVKGTMVTAQRGDHTVTRNISFYKVIGDQEDTSDEDDLDEPRVSAQQAKRNPLRQKRLPAHFENFEL